MTAAGRRFSLPLAGEADTIRLGGDLALALKPGDCLAMSGDLGAGKSTLARAFLRAMAQDPQLEVPSPTFTLVQLYDLRIPVAHFDFYRLGDAADAFTHEMVRVDALQAMKFGLHGRDFRGLQQFRQDDEAVAVVSRELVGRELHGWSP